jgi:hypothetical protein
VQNKLRDFVDSPWTWGAIGMLAGAVTSVIPLATFFTIAWVIFTAVIIRIAFSGGTGMLRAIWGVFVWSAILLATLGGAYRFLPKPPTTADMAVEILNRVPGLKLALAQPRVPVEPARTEPSKQASNFVLSFKPPTASEIADEIVKRTSSASESQLRAMAPGIVGEMRNWLDKWDSEEIAIRIQSSGHNSLNLTPQDRNRLVEQYSDMNKDYTSKILPVMTSANYLREQLLRGSAQVQKDPEVDAVFAKVFSGQSINVNDFRRVTAYMGDLVKRLIPSSPAPSK